MDKTSADRIAELERVLQQCADFIAFRVAPGTNSKDVVLRQARQTLASSSNKGEKK